MKSNGLCGVSRKLPPGGNEKPGEGACFTVFVEVV
jgi:hypothetical protein